MTDTGGVIMFIFEDETLGEETSSKVVGFGNTKVEYDARQFGNPEALLEKLNLTSVVEIYTDVSALLDSEKLSSELIARGIGFHDSRRKTKLELE